MKDDKKLVLFSENEKLYKAFRRALPVFKDFLLKIPPSPLCQRGVRGDLGFIIVCANLSACVFHITKKGFSQDKNMVLLYVDSNKDNMEIWLWGKIRQRYLNPLVIIGFDTKEDFEVRHPVFKDRPYSHTYISIPFDLKCLVKKIEEVKPIYDNDTRRMIYEDYCKGYEYKLITHDLKILSGDREKTVENFCEVRDFYKGKGDKNTVKYISEVIEKIKEEENWEQIAKAAQKTLEDRLKGETS